MAITVCINANGVQEKIEVDEGKKIDFSHPGSPMTISSEEGKVLLVVHPSQWVYAKTTK